MPPPNKRRKHTVTLNTRRSKDSFASESSEDYSYEQQKEEETIPFEPDDQTDHIDFKNDLIINDISDLFSFCKMQINTRFLSTLVYMSLRRFGHTCRDVDSFLTTTGGMTAKTCQKWTNLLVHNDFDDFIADGRGGKHGDSFWDLHTDLEMEARDFVLHECSKKEAAFTAERLAKFIDDRFYELNKLKKVEDKLVRSIESCRLDLRRFGWKYTENKGRPYFLGHEREDVVQHREQFVKYFMEHKDHFYTVTEGEEAKWVQPNIRPIVLLCHDESTYKSGEISAKRWIVEDNAPFYNKGRGKSIMASDFLVMHKSEPFFSLNYKEFKEALHKYPDLNNDSDIIYEKRTASVTMNIGGNSYFDNETILKQFERLFQLLYFKADYKDHDFVCLVDNARTHTAVEYSVNDFAMKPRGRCPVDTIEYVDDQNTKRIIDCYDDDGESKGLLKLAEELNLHVPESCKLPELKMIVSQHPAFKNSSRLEKLGVKYGVKIIFAPKFHCETNPIEGFWCHSKQFIRKNTDQTFQALVSLMPKAKQNFIERDIHLKLFRRFWRTIKAYSDGKDYLEVLTMFFSGLCKDKILSHRKITNANIDD